MTAELTLARAIARVVRSRLEVGLGYLRIPEIVSPFPIQELVAELRDMHDIRYAVFLESDMPKSEKVTDEVHEAIHWRNDANISDHLVIVGDLQRDRAAGLANVPTITASDVRAALLDELTADARSRSASAKTVKLLQSLKSDRLSVDVHYLADYAQSVAPTFGTSDLEQAVGDLWRLKLLPDKAAADVDIRRLRENAQRVNDLRQSDATTIQRLISQMAAQDASSYEALRGFARTGDRDYLRGLQLDIVRNAMRSVRVNDNEDDSEEDKDEGSQGRSEQTQFLDAVRSNRIDERDFLTQFDYEGDEDSPENISVNGTDLDWDRVPGAQLAPMLEASGQDVPYAESAGSYELMEQDEPDPLPGKGSITWDSLRDVLEDLRSFEEDVELDSYPSRKLEEIIELRIKLTRFVPDIPREGIRLFLSAPSISDTAVQLVSAWVDFWQATEKLLHGSEEVGELLRVVRRLTLTDTRVVEQGTAVTAYLLPLHPIVLEPRVRAAMMFRKHSELDNEFFRIVNEAIDPAVPSLKLPAQETTYDLAYSGQFRSLPQYERRAQQFHSPDVVRALQDVIDRFLNAHPYARRSFRVALVDPTAETAKQLLKWLANVDPQRRERVAIDVYLQHESPDEVKAKLAEAQEELISAEINATRFSYSVEVLKVDRLHARLGQSDRAPHLLCFFDPAQVTQNVTPIANLTPALGALVNEWEFGARKQRDATPYIRPRTGSSALNKFLSAQARLLGNDTVGTTEREPLLPADILRTLESVELDTTWVVVAQGASALVAPPSIGRMELLGRTSSGNHTAYVYSGTPILVVEPVLTYLQQHAYIQANTDNLVRFVLDTIRLALPEGLLGFYKRQGTLSGESVLGRLGLAAVVAYLQAASDGPRDLIVSLDTEGARRWLGLREGIARRADLIRFSFDNGACHVEAIEIKARSGSLAWGSTPPDAAREAVEQVRAMYGLLEQIFAVEDEDLLAASRREILKRQVFLEALHQWEPLRGENPAAYREQIHSLNRLFARDETRLQVDISERVFLATPGDEGVGQDGVEVRSLGNIEVIQLGLGWFKSHLARQPGGSIELDPELLDMMDLGSLDLDTEKTEIGNEALNPTDKVSPPYLESFPDEETPPGQGLAHVPESVSGSAISTAVDVPREGLRQLLDRLQESFSARGIPYLSVSSDNAVIGPSVIQFPVRLQVGARTSQVESQADDIARDLGVQAFRITNFPGRPGFALAEVPRAERDIPDVTSLLRPDLGYPALAVGAKLDFTPYWDCLDHFPHLLIAGRTGSGKSVLIRSLLWQLTRLYGPEELDLVLMGPKAADYLDFTTAPHFKSSSDVHLRSDGAIDLLRDIVETRYPRQQALFDEYARNAVLSGTRISNLRELMAHAAAAGESTLLRPFVVIIDEFVEMLDASLSARKDFEGLISRFSRLFRYIGGTMILATQRPSVKSITGDIKANFRPLALRVERSVDSRVILDEGGAEQLIGQGDCLYKADEGLVRLQGYAALGTYVY